MCGWWDKQYDELRVAFCRYAKACSGGGASAMVVGVTDHRVVRLNESIR